MEVGKHSSLPKPIKGIDKGTSYRPISILSVIAKTLEKRLLSYITENIPNTSTQHRYKTQHSTVINIHTLIKKLQQTKIPGTIIKFITNYIKGHKTFTTYLNHTSSQRQFKLAFHKVLSTTLFNIYTDNTTTRSTRSDHCLRR